MADFKQLIARIKQRFQEGGYQNESAVREAIVLPILAALGWDVLEPDMVRREFNLSGRRVDYALCPLRRTPSVFFEVKAPNQTLGGDRQLFEYAFHEGIPMAVLTDGKEWNFYLPGEQGSYDERRFYKLDLSERDDAECCTRLTRYLEFTQVKEGRAIESARGDYRQAARTRTAAESIPKAWHELVDEPDELLMELIAEKAESISGFRPDSEDIERFLVHHLFWQDSTTTPQKRVPVSNKNQGHVPPIAPDRPKNISKASNERQIEFEVLGQKKNARNAKEAMITILQEIGKQNSDFWEKLAHRARTKKRNHLARTREDVYPNRPDLAENTFEIAPGWWIGTNIANREKHRIIKAACECAKLTFGRDVKINLPNLAV